MIDRFENVRLDPETQGEIRRRHIAIRFSGAERCDPKTVAKDIERAFKIHTRRVEAIVR